MDEREQHHFDTDAASERRASFVAAISRELADAEDSLPGKVATTNASTRSKLRKIYEVADELSRVREPFVACGKGCASCCHMNISITSAEAELLAKASGRRPATLVRSPEHAADAFSGQPCPFLDGQRRCTVYADRPLSCRKHASFFQDDGPCHPSVMNEIEVPQMAFSGLDQALFAVSGEHRNPILADIRDFFPPATKAQI